MVFPKMKSIPQLIGPSAFGLKTIFLKYLTEYKLI